MLAGVVAAILVLAPAKVADNAVSYASIILRQANDQHINPLIVVSTIHVETGGQWDNTLISKTDDYGLMQVHVSRSTNPDFIGRETDLLDPETNIREGVRVMVYWKKYHNRCKKSTHQWWAHYQAGVEVKSDAYSKKVSRVLARVKNIKYLSQEDQLDHCNRRTGCQRQSYASQGSIGCPTAIDRHLFPEVLWTFWCSHSGAFEGGGGALPAGQDHWGLVNISRRRRCLSSPDDDGQVRCSV